MACHECRARRRGRRRLHSASDGYRNIDMRMLLADSFLHHFDPFAFRFSENVGVRWYGLSYAVGFLLAWLFARWMAKSGRSTLTVRDVGDMMFSVILGVLIGGRLGYAILYEQRLLTD